MKPYASDLSDAEVVHSGFATELFGEKIMCGSAAHNLLTKTLGWGLHVKACRREATEATTRTTKPSACPSHASLSTNACGNCRASSSLQGSASCSQVKPASGER